MLTVDNLMTFDPDRVAPDTILREAVGIMNGAGHRHLLVVEDEKLIGIVTDRDIRLAVNSPLLSQDAAERIEMLNNYTVADCMTTEPMTVTPEMPIHEVAGLFSMYKFGALPVVDGDELVGIITVTDLLNQMALLPEPKA